MAFSFGSSTPAATAPASSAPAPSVFSFGTPTSAAPTPSTGAFSFGAKAPAPSTSAFSFGAKAPSSSAFGSAPAAPAPFGTTTPGVSGTFGTSPAPAGGLFGKSPAPTGSLFGTSPAPAFGTSASTPAAFGSAPPAQPPQPTPPVLISAQTPYQNLPPEAKQAIDTLHEHYLRHKRTMLGVETMVPSLLRQNSDAPADAAAGGTQQPLPIQLEELSAHVEALHAKVQSCGSLAHALKGQCEQSTTQSIKYGVWPLEAMAVRRGVKLTDSQRATRKTDPTVQEKLREELEKQAAHVDRLEEIPSPFYLQTLQDLESRIRDIRFQVDSLSHQVNLSKKIREVGIATVVQEQMDVLAQVSHDVQQIHSYTETMRQRYRTWEKGGNVLEKALIEDFTRKQRLDDQVKIEIIKAVPAAPPQAPGFGPFGAPTPASAGGLFGAPAPPPAVGLFGTPAPPPVGGLFGKAPAPSAFGTPAPAPSTGLFGSTTPAPAPGAFSFGSAPTPAFGAPAAPAPAGGAFAFGSTSTTPKTKSKGRSSRRR